MPLITCPDCGRSISDAAPACIYCGRPAAARRPPPARPEAPVPQAPKASAPDMPPASSPGSKKRTAGEWLGGIFGFGIVYLFFHLPVDSLALKMLGGGVVGLLLGLIPFSQAKKAGASQLAGWSLVVCALGGAASGILFAVPLCLLFLWAARRRLRKGSSTTP